MPFYKLYYHIVWGTKNRLPLITPKIEAGIYRNIVAKVCEFGGVVYACGGLYNHVHIAVSLPPKYALAQMIGQLKGSSSHFVNHVLGCEETFRWQNEYGVLTIGEKQLPWVVKYIKNQKKHHKEGRLFPEFEAL
jgi:putative transposase